MKTLTKYLFIISLSMVFLGTACKKQAANEEDLGYEYVPFSEGYYQIFEVDSISFDLSDDTASYQLKEVVGEVFIDELGRSSRKLYRYKRYQDTAAWELDIVYYAYKDISRYERVENDQRIIAMVFPVRNGKTWDGNEFNTSQALDNTINNVGSSHSVLGVTYNDCAEVEILDEFNFIQYKDAKAFYANGVGLIDYYFIDLEINNADINNISRGVKYYQKLIAYGFE